LSISAAEGLSTNGHILIHLDDGWMFVEKSVNQDHLEDASRPLTGSLEEELRT
jgi:hypothetical protein